MTNTNCKREINFSGHFGHLSAETENRACHLVRAQSECANGDQVGKNVAPYVTGFGDRLYARGARLSELFSPPNVSSTTCALMCYLCSCVMFDCPSKSANRNLEPGILEQRNWFGFGSSSSEQVNRRHEHLDERKTEQERDGD